MAGCAWLLVVIVLLAHLGGAAMVTDSACTAESLLEEHMRRLPVEELLLLDELIAKPHQSTGSAGHHSTSALIHELARSEGEARVLLLQALDELGGAPDLDGRCGTASTSPPGAANHPFVYFLHPGAGDRLQGVIEAFLCFLLDGLAAGPASSTDAGIATCHRFPRFCESWFYYRPGTRIEVFGVGADSSWYPGTVVSSTVRQVHEGGLTGDLTVKLDDDPSGQQLMKLVMPGNIFRHLAEGATYAQHLVRWWDMSAVDQELFLAQTLWGADFVLNPIGLGRDVLEPGFRAQDWGGDELIYIAVLHNPLDAVADRFLASQHRHFFRPLEELVAGGACPFAVGDMPCWDSDFYVQALSEPGLCKPEQVQVFGEASDGGRGRLPEGWEVCSHEAEEQAVARVEAMQVVLMADWLHLSGPLVCEVLGQGRGAWCDPAAWRRLSQHSRVQDESASSSCGGGVAGMLGLDLDGGGKEGQEEPGRGGAAAALVESLVARNRRDLRLFAAARARARKLLEAVGVSPPADVGEPFEWGRRSVACAGRAGAGGNARDLGGHWSRSSVQGARVHEPLWMRCRRALPSPVGSVAAEGAGGAGGGGPGKGLTEGLKPSRAYLQMQKETEEGGGGRGPEQAWSRQPHPSESWSQHGEELYAYHTFFWEQAGGSFLELGAVDGETFSNTLGILERRLGWKGLLVEADPKSFEMLPHKRPGQIGVHAAICGEPEALLYCNTPPASLLFYFGQAQDVHWADADDPRFSYTSIVSGIAEFLAPEHKQRFYSHLHQSADPWAQVLDSLPVVRCLPLTSVLEAFGAFHTNFFVLDVEVGLQGAEMSILSSLDWSRFSFDVLCIENQYSAEANEAIKLFLASRGYTFWALVPEGDGKNNWFTRQGFRPENGPGGEGT